ncbi:DegT/DnrJ/EryC1/StrS family aminotransferase [Sphingobium sp. MI1205]|uniref:DegT/DnrJ/EryC1/StrS family aminotransferase n=1 Tax=Sphingobium sp. MI1205 TaxID=407020 RepID=UPI0007705DF3|nr:DegT/DnrJ/EryC1/StrS family aminotransferase [Sphingobium sp. MI1205]AMK18942.1 DegT/DnrJ/EryC1/StrS aminotransferase [Sphingobium sp. MI1205]
MNAAFPLATSTWDEAEYAAMQRVIASGQFTMGAEVRRFEEDFARFVGARYSVMVNSGSSANLLMIAALMLTRDDELRLRPGDEIIVPAVSWPTTYFPLYQYGLKLRFVDIDIETLNIDTAQVKAAITEKTRALFAVNLLGNPNEFNELKAVLSDHNIFLIEDNCESMGATFEGRQAGTFGVMGSFSTFFSHHISTMEGGVIVTDHEELYHILLSIRSHGWTRHLPQNNLICGKKSDVPFEESFRFVLPGYNLRPLELSGAIGVEQVNKLPGIISARRENGRMWQDALTNHPDLMIQREVGASSWFGFSLVIRPESALSRTELLDRLQSAGFECRPIVAGNFAEKEVVAMMDHSIFGSLKNAQHIDTHGLFIGNHHYPMDDAMKVLAEL